MSNGRAAKRRSNERAAKRRKRGASYRDPSKGRQRPYQRYASRTLNKRALRAMAMQAIGRPAVAQGPLHDALLEVYGAEYARKVAATYRAARFFKKPHAIVFDAHTQADPRFKINLWTEDLEERWNGAERLMHEWGLGPHRFRQRGLHNFVVTFVAHPPAQQRDTRIQSRRDPGEPEGERKRKRPYERYAARKMSKLALRRLALQSIGRPKVAQGPLHDALIEVYGNAYSSAIDLAERDADHTGRSHAVLFIVGEMTKLDESRPVGPVGPFWIVQYHKDLETSGEHVWSGSGPQVVTYVAWRKRRKGKSNYPHLPPGVTISDRERRAMRAKNR